MIRSLTTLVLILSSNLESNAMVEVSGTVMDITGEPVPYCNIIIEDTFIGTASNKSGKYILKIPDKYISINTSIIFSSLGFLTYKVSVNDLLEQTNITLQPSVIELPEIVIQEDFTAETILLRSLENATSNSNLKPLTSRYFYRSEAISKVRDSLLFSIDAALTAYFPNGFSDLTENKGWIWKIDAVRKNEKIFNSNYYKLYQLAPWISLANSLRMNSHTIFDRKNHKYFDFEVKQEIFYEDEIYFVIGYKANNVSKKVTGFIQVKDLIGEIIINKTDYGIISLITALEFKPGAAMKYAYFESHYRKFHDNKYYLTTSYLEQIMPNEDLITHQILTTNLSPGNPDDLVTNQLDLTEIKNDPEFWNKYNLISH